MSSVPSPSESGASSGTFAGTSNDISSAESSTSASVPYGLESGGPEISLLSARLQAVSEKIAANANQKNFICFIGSSSLLNRYQPLSSSLVLL